VQCSILLRARRAGGGQGQRALLLLWQGFTKTFLKFANITTNFLMLAANDKTV
jgi:hypothetical protein